MGVMQVELQISKKMAIWDDSFKGAGKGGFGAELVSPIKHLKGDFIWKLIQDFISSWIICITSTLPKSKGFLPDAGFCSH